MYYIYALKQNNVIKYIGQTINPIKRQCAHKNTRDDHKFEIIFSTEDKEIAKKKEIEFIVEYDTYYNGWNKSPGGEGFEDYTRKGIGGVKKGSVPWNKNKKGCFSEETISHFSNIRKGKIWNLILEPENYENKKRLNVKIHLIFLHTKTQIKRIEK